MQIDLVKLNNVPFEQWPNCLKAVSANSHGWVHSGITKDNRYFYRKWEKNFVSSCLVWG